MDAETKALIETIGPIRETFYGGFWEFEANLSAADLAYTAFELPLHTDARLTMERSVVRRTRRTCLDAYAHQDLPFARLVQELRPERDPSRPPIAQVGFAMQNVPRAPKLPGALHGRHAVHGLVARPALDEVEDARAAGPDAAEHAGERDGRLRRDLAEQGLEAALRGERRQVGAHPALDVLLQDAVVDAIEAEHDDARHAARFSGLYVAFQCAAPVVERLRSARSGFVCTR